MWRRYPLHLIVGLDLILTGLILLTHHHYFFWPPWPAWVMEAENGIAIGLIGVVVGLGMIYWAVSSNKSIKLNQVLIPTASAYFTLLAVTEILHGFFAPLGTPHMYTSARRYRSRYSIGLTDNLNKHFKMYL